MTKLMTPLDSVNAIKGTGPASGTPEAFAQRVTKLNMQVNGQRIFGAVLKCISDFAQTLEGDEQDAVNNAAIEVQAVKEMYVARLDALK